MIELTDDERIKRIKQGGIDVGNTDISIGTEVIIGDTLEKGVVTKLNFLGISGAFMVCLFKPSVFINCFNML